MVDFFTTQIALGTGNTANTTKSALTGATISNEETNTTKIDFLKFILGRLEESDTQLQKQLSNKQDAKGVEDLLSKKLENEKADLALLKLALLGQDIDQDLDQKLADLKIEQILLKQENRIEQIEKLVNHLTSGLPKPPESGTIANLVQRLNQRLGQLEASLDSFRTGDYGAEGSPFELLIATGLNPAQLTDITNRIEEVENKLGRELTVEDLIAGVGNIIPAPGDSDHEFAAPDAINLLIERQQEQSAESEIKTEEKIKEKEEIEEITAEEAISLGLPLHNNILKEIGLNTLPAQPVVTPLTGKKLVADTSPLKNINTASALGIIDSNTGTLPPASNAANTGDGADAAFTEDLDAELGLPLSNAEFKTLFGNDNNIGKNNVIGKGTVQNNALLTAIQNAGNQLNLLSNAALTAELTAVPAAQLGFSDALGFDLQTGTPFTQAIQAAHLVSSPNSVAGQTHPATSTVATQITKSAQSANTNSVTLYLDPADLGKLEIQLEFGKEKSVKVHLIVEKPETLLMLQRDANALEKALQNAGLEANSDSLNFEMAAEDHNFHSGKDSQQSGSSKTGTDLESDNEDIIVTNMTWDVDPETGHVHYSILA